MPRATGEDRERPGHHPRRDADRREGPQGDGALLRSLPQVLEKVRIVLLQYTVRKVLADFTVLCVTDDAIAKLYVT